MKESSSHFSKTKRVINSFSKAAIEFQYIHPTYRKKSTKIRERIQPIGKRNQPTDALAGLENSNEIQKLFAYPA